MVHDASLVKSARYLAVLLPKGRSEKECRELEAGFAQDQQGRTKGVEDPENPALIDDPAIFASSRRLSIPWFFTGAIKPTEPAGLIESDGKAYIDPKLYGGSNLNKTTTTLPVTGEPLNVIISALSSPSILTARGLQGYLRSLNLDFECFGLHAGGPQQAFLDPRGYVDQRFLYREVFTPLDHVFGTCIESLRGGNHIRAWQQMGTGAWFLAASKEEDAIEKHMIVPNGYNLGRDWLAQQVQKDPLNTTDFMFKTYRTKLEYVDGLLPPGAANVNHNISQDGRVLLMTVELISGAKEKAALASRRKEVKSSKTPQIKARAVEAKNDAKKGRLIRPLLLRS